MNLEYSDATAKSVVTGMQSFEEKDVFFDLIYRLTEKIAKEGFQIHVSYPDFQPDQLPTADMNRLMYLDEMWIKECVSGLPAESIFNIIQKVEHDFYSGE